MPKTVHPVFDYFAYDANKNESKCLVAECGLLFKGKHASNLVKHIQRRHKNLNGQLDEKVNKHGRRQPISKKKKCSFVNVKICREDILIGCLESVVIDGRPFNLMQGKGLQRILRPIIDEFDRIQMPISINPEYVQRKGMEVQESIKEKIKSEMRGKLVSLQFDLTTRMNRHILGVNTQYYIDDEFYLRNLAMRTLSEKTTALNLAHEIEQILKEYDLSIHDIYTITTDNGPNVLSCTKILRLMQERKLEEYLSTQNADTVDMEALMDLIDIETERIRCGQTLHFLFQIHCAAHTLNLVLGDVLGMPEIKNFLATCRSLVKNLRRPTIVKLMQKKGLNLAVIDCDTRWNSVYDMVGVI